MKEAEASLRSEAATVVTFSARAGEYHSASHPSLPAATAVKTPESTRLFTASSTAWEPGPPRDMLATDPAGALAATQSIPAITSA